MTATQKAIFTIIYFLCMLPLSYLSRRWLLKQICEAGGTTVEESRKKQREFAQQGGNWQMHYQSWILQNATDKTKYMRLFRLYQLCLAPNLICFFFSLGGLYTHAVDKILMIGMIVVPILIIVVGGIEISNQIRNKK